MLDVSHVTPIASAQPKRLGEFFREPDASGNPTGKIMYRERNDEGQWVVRQPTNAERLNYMRTAGKPEKEKAPQCLLKASLDEETGDYVIRIPSKLDPKHIGPSSTDKSLVAKYVVELPEDSLMEVEWREGTAYHRISGDRAGAQLVNLNLILGLDDKLAPSKA